MALVALVVYAVRASAFSLVETWR